MLVLDWIAQRTSSEYSKQNKIDRRCQRKGNFACPRPWVAIREIMYLLTLAPFSGRKIFPQLGQFYLPSCIPSTFKEGAFRTIYINLYLFVSWLVTQYSLSKLSDNWCVSNVATHHCEKYTCFFVFLICLFTSKSRIRMNTIYPSLWNKYTRKPWHMSRSRHGMS